MINLGLILGLIFAILVFTSNKSKSKDYYKLQDTYDKARDEFYKENYSEAKNLFKEIIKIDEFNIFWESYYYLSRIYLMSSEKDSAISILNKGIKIESANWDAVNFYKISIYAINKDIRIDINNINSYHYLYEKVGKIENHPFPTKNPKPVNGFSKFEKDIIDIISQKCDIKSVPRIYLRLTIDREGYVGRIEINKPQFTTDLVDRINKYIFNSRWHPALDGNNRLSLCFDFMINVKQYLEKSSKTYN